MLTAERLREIVEYDSTTGLLRWRETCGGRHAGAVAGGLDREGYVRLRVDGRWYRAHRLAWLYTHGCWPEGEIDHIDRNKSNNVLSNLRDISGQQNKWNQGPRRRSQSGIRGVSWYKPYNKWAATIRANGEHHFLGYFDDKEAAGAAWRRAAKRLQPIG